MSHSNVDGLVKRGSVWHINKMIGSHRLRQSTGESDLRKAQLLLARKIEEHRAASMYGIRPKRTFKQASDNYLKEYRAKTSIECDRQSINAILPFIGSIHVDKVHDGVLGDFIEWRRSRGNKCSTVVRDLAVVRRILNLCARKWRDEHNLSWLESAPLIEMPAWKDARKPRPITFEEQEALFALLPEELKDMVLFKVNTGCREQEVCGLRWEWEVKIPSLNTSVFVVPWQAGVKNGEDRVVVLNAIAMAAVNRSRARSSEFVFPVDGRRRERMNCSAWRTARKKVGLDSVRIHDLKHTCGARLRMAGVQLETRKSLLGHTTRDITSHYSAAEIGNLLEAVEKLVELSESNKSGIVLQSDIVTKMTHSNSKGQRYAARQAYRVDI